jgi:hypothetical protein
LLVGSIDGVRVGAAERWAAGGRLLRCLATWVQKHCTVRWWLQIATRRLAEEIRCSMNFI